MLDALTFAEWDPLAARNGLVDLVRHVRELQIPSYGGLDWRDMRRFSHH